jgi:hypothetical protein
MMAPPRLCQGVKCPCTGAGARVRGARERGGPQPRAGRTLERDETRSRGSEPSSGAGPLEGSVAPRTGRSLPEGARALERRGPSWWAVGVPRCGPCPAWLVTCMVRLNVFRYRDLSEDFPVV